MRVSSRGEQAGLKFDEQKGGHIQPIHVKPEHGLSDTPSGKHGHVIEKNHIICQTLNN